MNRMFYHRKSTCPRANCRKAKRRISALRNMVWSQPLATMKFQIDTPKTPVHRTDPQWGLLYKHRTAASKYSPSRAPSVINRLPCTYKGMNDAPPRVKHREIQNAQVEVPLLGGGGLQETFTDIKARYQSPAIASIRSQIGLSCCQ